MSYCNNCSVKFLVHSKKQGYNSFSVLHIERCRRFMQKEYEALQAQKEALYADYGKLKKKVREYDVIKQNIDSILQTGKQPERGKETERG